MKPVVQLSILLLIIIPSLQAQQPIDISKHNSNPVFQKEVNKKNPADTVAEINHNGIDDDGNGLVDMKDYACYFKTNTNCIPTTVVWASFRSALYWVDLSTNADRLVSFPVGESYADLTWTPSGKLYGAEEFTGVIMQINPATGQTQFAANVPGFYFTNGMTSDAEGNLYLSSSTPVTSMERR